MKLPLGQLHGIKNMYQLKTHKTIISAMLKRIRQIMILPSSSNTFKSYRKTFFNFTYQSAVCLQLRQNPM